jgi:rRNA maturation endonuclease Nob1
MATKDRYCASPDCLGDLEPYHFHALIDVKYCPQCGHEVTLICSECRRELPMPAAREFEYCPFCGKQSAPRNARST